MPYSDDEVTLTADERLLLARIERSLDADQLVSEPSISRRPVVGADHGWRLDALALLFAAVGGVALGLLPSAASSAAATTLVAIAAATAIVSSVVCGLAPLRGGFVRRRRRLGATARRRWRRLRDAVTLN